VVDKVVDERHTLDGVPRAEREDVWEDMLSRMILPMSVRLPTEQATAFRGQLRRQWLDDLALVECRTQPFRGHRGRSLLRSTGEEFVAILIGVSGAEYVTQQDAAVHVRPGGGIALSSTHSFDFDVVMPYHKRCLLIPATALSEVGVSQPLTQCLELRSAAPAVTLLDSYLATLFTTLPAMSGAARTTARNAALQLVAGVVNSGPDVGEDLNGVGFAPALRVNMDRWIDQHLLDAELGPESIAAAHAVSPRTVYRLFARDGETVGSVVRARRLARARAELVGSDHQVSTIAARWGFADASHFSRSFRDSYGVSPSAYRAESVHAGPDHSLVRSLRDAAHGGRT